MTVSEDTPHVYELVSKDHHAVPLVEDRQASWANDVRWPRVPFVGCMLLILSVMVISVRRTEPWRYVRRMPESSESALFAIGNVLERTSCGLAELGVDYFLSHSYRLTDVPDLDACCARCQSLPVCMAWTWVFDSGLVSGSATECYLKGGKFHKRAKKMKDGEAIPVRLMSGNATGRRPPSKDISTQFFNSAVVHSSLAAPGYVCPQAHAALPEVVTLPGGESSAQAKVLSYNLFWWNLFDHGRISEFHYFKNTSGNGAIELIATHARSFDLLAFQECIDVGWILEKAHIAAEFEGLQGPEEVCLAYRKDLWESEAEGWQYVNEDTSQEFWRRRGAQWAQLVHKATQRKLLFVNHHGPLPVGSGGVCGGDSTARNLLKLVAEKGNGRVVVLAGDFNAGRSSATVQTMRRHLTTAASGSAFGGVDNIFTNLREQAILNGMRLGFGGSDHGAIGAVLEM